MRANMWHRDFASTLLVTSDTQLLGIKCHDVNIIFCGDGNPRFLLKFAAVYGIFRAYSDHMFVILDRNEARGSAITVLTGPTSYQRYRYTH